MEINLRLRHAIYNVVANGGKPLSLAQAMRNAGYSESYARNPQKIKQTKLWEQETEDLFDKETLCKSLKSLLEARKLEFKAFPSSLGKEAVEELLTSIDCVVTKLQVGSKVIRVWYWSPDNRIRSQAIDMILRIHGEYKFPKPTIRR